MSKESNEAGLIIWTASAAALSYAKWHSIGWAVVHGLFGFAYVAYYLIRYVIF